MMNSQVIVTFRSCSLIILLRRINKNIFIVAKKKSGTHLVHRIAMRYREYSMVCKHANKERCNQEYVK